MDINGKVFFSLNDKSPNLNIDGLPKVVDNTNAPVNLGKSLLSSRQTQYIREMYLQVKAKDTSIESMELNNGGEQLDVRFMGDKYFVKFNLQADSRQSLGAYFAIHDKFSREGGGPSEYIDVRLPERVYVKWPAYFY